MQLHGIRIENYRSLREPVDIGPLSPGINVIHGPNETGKSTVMDAIARGLFDRHGVAGAEMQKRVPWGTKLGPAVSLEFEMAGKTYRVSKKFIYDPKCILEQKNHTGWERIAEGKTADQLTSQVLSATLPGVGISKAEHWGIAQALWVPQGQAAEPQKVSETQQNQIQQTLQLTLDTSQGEAIERAIQKRYDEVYTPGGGLRKGDKNKARSITLTDEVQALRTLVDELDQKQLQVQELVYKLDTAERAHAEVLREVVQSRQELQDHESSLLELAQQQIVYKSLEAARDKAQEAWSKVNKLVTQISEADKKAQEAARLIPGLESQESQLASHDSSLQDALKLTQEAISKARLEQEEIQARLDGVDRLIKHLQLTARRDQTREQIEKSKVAYAGLHEAKNALSAIVAPSQNQLKELRDLQRKIHQQQAVVDAGSLKLTFKPEGTFHVQQVVDGQQKQTVHTGPHDTKPVTLLALSSAELSIQGVGKIHAQAGRTDAHAEQKKLDDLAASWSERLSPLGTEDLEVLQQRIIERAELESKVKTLRDRCQELDPDQNLEASLVTLVNELAALHARHPELAQQPLAPDQHQLQGQSQAQSQQAELIRARDEVKAQITSLEKRVRQQQAAAKESTEKLNAIKLEISAARARAGAAQTQARLLRAEDGVNDEDRMVRLYEALSEKDAAQQRLAMTAKPAIEQARDQVERIKRAYEAQLKRERTLSDEKITLQDRLFNLGGQGLYDQWVLASEKLAEKQNELARSVLDEQAIKLLWETVSEKKRAVLDAVLGPVKNLVTVGLQQLTGPAYQSVTFDATLKPTAVRPTGRDVEPSPDELSYGTREQLMLLVRIALARLLSRAGERQCLLLDDPLVNTDRARQRSALAVLEEAGTECQLIIFTCHPGAYEGLANPAMFDLKKLSGK